MDHPFDLLSDFSAFLDQQIAHAWEQEGEQLHFEALASGADQLVQVLVEIGDKGMKQLAETTTWEGCMLTFLWPDQAKSLLILWRDILFQQQKASLLHQEGVVEAGQIRRLREASRQALEGAAADMKEFVATQQQRGTADEKGREKEVALWRLQENPWPVYREQLLTLARQSGELLEQYHKLCVVSEGFDRIREIVEKAAHSCGAELEGCKSLAIEAINYIEEALSPGKEAKPGKLVVHLEDFEEKIQLPDHLSLFNDAVEEVLEPMEAKLRVPIETVDGLIRYKEFTPSRSIRQWLETAVIPLLYEVWEITENLTNGLKMSLVNIRNRAILLSAESKPESLDKEDFSFPLENFLQRAEDWESQFASLQSQITSRMDREFRLAHIYDPGEGLLPVPLQSSINQLRLHENLLWVQTGKWVRRQLSKLERFRVNVELEESLSDAEKIVRFIRSRTVSEEANPYTSIFLTKGYMGESFWVGREEKIRHMESLVENWRRGFGGAVILTGRRLSGRSLFGELVANRLFPHNTIRLSPNLPVQVQGRSMPAGYDLDKALEFVRKHSLNQFPLVWIDDLELWWDASLPLNRNVRNLRKHIDRHSNQHFFLISVSNGLREHLKRFHGIEQFFQAEINLDRMEANEIRDAILIRHGATHKMLVDATGKELTPQQFQKITHKISRAVGGNIGDALNRWAYSVRMVDEDQVCYEESPGYVLPDFLTPDVGLLLATIMMEKRTNEYRLRKLFGAPFRDRYGGILQRLLGVRLLTRQIDGWLEINEAIVNDLGEMLSEKNYL